VEPDSSHVDPQLGRILIERGLVTEVQMREVIALQRQAEQESRPIIPRLGELLVEKGYATAEQVREALSAQNRKILYCTKCSLHVNVDLRPDVVVYRCGRCETPLVEPPSGEEIKVVESTIMFVIRDPLPPDVQARIQDPSSKFGKYILVSELGRGGVGIVHKAWDTYLGQFVALKRLKPLSASRRETAREAHIHSLLKEARSAVRLRHPHIATVYDVGRIGREFYMSMEYLEGRTLSRDLNDARTRNEPSPLYGAPKRYLRYLRDVARALHYAHTRPAPVIHCDLKPSNVMIDSSDRAYVLDFGLARNLRGLQDEHTGAVSGTPSYMAPEQASGHTEDIDARTDVYGLGAVLYELIASRPPFLGSVQSVLRKALSEMPERPAEVASLGPPGTRPGKLPVGLEEACLRCLEKERTMRFQSAHDVADVLDRILKGDTGRVRPVPGAVTPAPSPAPALPAPAPPARPAPAGGSRAFMFGIGALAAAMLLAVVSLVSRTRKPPDPGPPPPPPRTPVERLESYAAAFRSDVALEECRAALKAPPGASDHPRLEALLEELQWMDVARTRVIDAIHAQRPPLAALRLRSRTLANVEVLKAVRARLVVDAGDRVQEIGWSEVAPEQVFALVDACLKPVEPPDALGLALYARRAGLPDRARRLFDSLKGTPLEAKARQYDR